ncbi:hypothetical protein, partial [Staphylococcus haemolyticus]|uniref:hypothetical protein n=1 Tax=Staphylococcus haemolyticus TaxID=1283 RepID=UPI0012B16D53
ENNQKIYKKDNFYIISIEIVFFHLSKNFMSRTLSPILNPFNNVFGRLTNFIFWFFFSITKCNHN